MLRHVKRRGLCTSATHRVTATPKPLEFNDPNSINLGIQQNSSTSHELLENSFSQLSDDTLSMNSQNGTLFLSSLDPQSPRPNIEIHLSPTSLSSLNPTLLPANLVSPATNGNTNYDSLSPPHSQYFGSPAQALSSHEVSIEDTIQIVSVILESSNIEDTDNSSGSLSDSESEDEHSSFSLALRNWCDQSGTSRDHMTSLIQLLRQFGHDKFPLDWRTQLKRCSELDALNGMGLNAVDVSNVEVVLVCGECFLHTFSNEDVEGATTCASCNVTVIQCRRPKCKERCVVISRLGRRTLNSLTHCSVCLIGQDSVATHRTFRFPLYSYIKAAFMDGHLAPKFMAPFKGFCDLRQDSPSSCFHLHCEVDWLSKWRHAMRDRDVSSQLWHGRHFWSHPLWSENGPRSLLLLASLDWFPPFKQRDYSIGVLTVTPANLSCSDRAARSNTWVLAVLEGPKEPLHVYNCLAPSFEEMRKLQECGLEVFDICTGQTITVHASCALVCADVPACAKLGNHVGHSAYMPCISCEYIGSVCGCKGELDQDMPARWCNFEHKVGDTQRKFDGIHRKSKAGEHIVFLDTDTLLPHHLRTESSHRNGLKEMTQLLNTARTQAEFDRAKARTRVAGPSVLSLLNESHFKFITGFVFESMHTIVKGTFARLWYCTTHKDKRKHPGNVNFYKGGLTILRHRFSKFKFPVGMAGSNRFVQRRNCLKAEQLYVIIRVCGPFIFNGILPKEFVELWALWCKLYTNLLHIHVLKDWILSTGGFRFQLSQALTQFQTLYGVCNLPSNFHRLLHLVGDFQAWGNLRSHWAFPLERVYGALMTRNQHQNRSLVTVSVVNSIPRMYQSENAERDMEQCGRICQNPPTKVLWTCPQLRTLLRTGANWITSLYVSTSRRWHTGEIMCVLKAGESLSPTCFFQLVGILHANSTPINSTFQHTQRSSNFFVLRTMLGITARRFFARSSIFYTITCIELSDDDLGEQVMFVPSELVSDSVCICPVVNYTLADDGVVLIPTCGLICFD